MQNWAGNQTYRSSRVLLPESVDEVQEVVHASRRLRAIGSRHSFNDVADTDGDHVSLAHLPRMIAIDRDMLTVSVDAGSRYGDVCAELDAAGFALSNLASLPHISIAGACATATHGSGVTNGNLATAVVGLEIVRADGETEEIGGEAGSLPLEGAVVSLGVLGIVTRVTLRLEPSFQVSQVVYEDVPFERTYESFGEIMGAAYSVSLFTDWSGDAFGQVWLKARLGPDAVPALPATFFGGRPAKRQLHPVPGFPADACTAQGGIPGPWHHRLPHFRLDHTPSAGDELQSEYLIASRDAVAAIKALHAMRARIAPLVFVSEVRAVAADELWLSPSHGRETVALHFTWRNDWPAVRTLLPEIERALAPFDPRPHWGKLFTFAPDVIRSAYPRRRDFVELAERLDPQRKFRNDFVDRFMFGEDGAGTAP
jgi:xylitol oxidase